MSEIELLKVKVAEQHEEITILRKLIIGYEHKIRIQLGNSKVGFGLESSPIDTRKGV